MGCDVVSLQATDRWTQTCHVNRLQHFRNKHCCHWDAWSPVGTSMELSESFLSCLWMESIHILGDQPVQLSSLFPTLQNPVSGVRMMRWELRPPQKIPRPVTLTGLGTTDKLDMLHGTSVSAGVQAHAFWAVIWDARFRGEASAADDKQPCGLRDKVLE